MLVTFLVEHGKYHEALFDAQGNVFFQDWDEHSFWLAKDIDHNLSLVDGKFISVNLVDDEKKRFFKRKKK